MSLKKAALINAISKYVKILLQLLFTAVLSRILTPNDYGIVAVITVFTTFFSTIGDMGFGTAVIQNKKLSEKDINNIYSCTIYISLILAFVFFFFSFGIANFYDNDVYIPLGMLLSISIFFNAANMIPNAILMKEKKFVIVAFRTIIVCIIANAITIGMAYAGFKYYALAIQSILVAFFTYIWNYLTTKPRFCLKIKKESINKVISFSMFQFGFNFINYFSRNLDNLLVGKFLGDAELGYYNKAYTLMLYPVNNLSGVISPVLHPILSDFQNQKEILYKKFIKLASIMALIGVFIAPYCWLAANELVIIIFGQQWERSVNCFQFLSIAILTQMMNSFAGALFQSLGKTKLLFINSVVNTLITLLAVFMGLFIWGNIEVLSICVAVAYIIHFFTAYGMLITYGFNTAFLGFLKEFKIEIFILIVLIIATILYPFNIANLLMSAIIKLFYLGAIYFILLLITKRIKLYKELLFSLGGKQN